MNTPRVVRNGKVYLGAAAIGDVQRIGKKWLVYVYGQPSKTSWLPTRREAVSWILRQRTSLNEKIAAAMLEET